MVGKSGGLSNAPSASEADLDSQPLSRQPGPGQTAATGALIAGHRPAKHGAISTE